MFALAAFKFTNIGTQYVILCIGKRSVLLTIKKKERSIGMLTSLLCKNKLFMQQNIFLNKQRSVIQKLEPLKLNVCCSNELHGLGLNTVRINLHIQSSVEAFQVPLVCF